MERTTKIQQFPKSIWGNGRWCSSYRVTFYLGGGYIVSYTRYNRESARALAREYKATGMCLAK